MDNHDQDSVPADILRVYRDMGIWTEQERRVFGDWGDREQLFSWLEEPRIPSKTSDRTFENGDDRLA